MTHVVAISPHLDDAAFSVGGLLAAYARDGARVTVVTCFTATVAAPTGFALACQLDKGLDADVDYMARRRAEDLAACAVIGAAAVHLPFREAPHRGYASAPELFGGRRMDDGVLSPLTVALRDEIAALAPDLLLGPLCIGNHVDHWIVREALAATGRSHLLWEDWPYLQRTDAREAGAPVRSHLLSEADRAARIAMCAAYETQIGFQFGGLSAMTERIARIDQEHLHAT